MPKPCVFLLVGFAAVVSIIFTACTSEVPGPTPTPIPETGNKNPAIITDHTGREWDVTYARDVYGMNPEYFNYGLGIGAIPSVDAPIALEEGAAGYPDSDSRIQVFGVNHNSEQRAYDVRALTRHEVFNDIYPGESNQYVSVAY